MVGFEPHREGTDLGGSCVVEGMGFAAGRAFLNPNQQESDMNPTTTPAMPETTVWPMHARRVWLPKRGATTVKTHNTRNVLGVDISVMDTPEFLHQVHDALAKGDTGEGCHFIATVNPEFLVDAAQDPAFRDTLGRTSANTADGTGICLALKLLHGVSQPRITGSDSMGMICAECARTGRPVFLLGAAPGVAAIAAEKLMERIPGLEIAGTYSPDNRSDGFDDYPAQVQDGLRRAGAVFVALGAPAQEHWIRKNRHHLTACRLAVGVGGTFDFIAGVAHRAPEWMRRTGLEWLYRLLSQPSRWRRMLKLPTFMRMVASEWLTSAGARSVPSHLADTVRL